MRAFVGRAGRITNFELGRRGQMAWVQYATPGEAAKAIALTGQDFGGRDVRVEMATREPGAVPREYSA